MSLLAVLRNEAPVEEVSRWVVILPALEDLNVPAMRIKLKFMAQDTLNTLMKPLAKKEELSDKDESRFRKTFAKYTWEDWDGVVFANLERVSAWFFQRSSSLKKEIPETGIEFGMEDAMWLAEKMDTVIWNKLILKEALDLEKYAQEKIEQEKKD